LLLQGPNIDLGAPDECKVEVECLDSSGGRKLNAFRGSADEFRRLSNCDGELKPGSC